MELQTLTGAAFSEDGIWVSSGWDGPTGEFTSGQMYGLKFGNRLLRLDIVDDPITAIRRELPQTVEGLLEALESKDHLVKKCAGEALVKFGASAHTALPTLLKRYKQGDEAMDWIILGLAKAAGSSAVSSLTEGLTDTDAKVRQKAAEALGEIGEAALPAVPKLVQALADPVPDVLVTSALSLRKIEKRDHGEVSALITLLGSTNSQAPLMAACALGEFGSDAAKAVPSLLKYLERGDREAAGFVAGTFGMIGPEAKCAIPSIIELLDSKDPHTLMFATAALGQFGEDAKAAIPKLLELAGESEPSWNAISALSFMGTDAVPGLVEIYRNEGRGRWFAARAFMTLGPKAAGAVTALVEDLAAEKTGQVALAAMVLGRIGDEAKVALPQLAELARAEDPRLRIRAAEALWLLDRQTNVVLPVMILELETWMKEPDALRSRRGDVQGQCRQEIAAAILQEIGPAAHEAIPALQMMLRSSFEEHRSAAEKALAQIERPSESSR